MNHERPGAAGTGPPRRRDTGAKGAKTKIANVDWIQVETGSIGVNGPPRKSGIHVSQFNRATRSAAVV